MSTQPIPMILHCPACGAQHIDQPDPARGWHNPAHRSHECQTCGGIWRPADVPTTGVQFIESVGSADTFDFRESAAPARASCALVSAAIADCGNPRQIQK